MDLFNERREFVRMPASAAVQVCCDRKCVDCFVVDISPGGCQLLAQGLTLVKGKKLKLRFLLQPAEPVVDVHGKVIWAKKARRTTEKNRYGIQFKEREKFKKLGPMFLDYVAFKKKMEILRKEERKEKEKEETI